MPFLSASPTPNTPPPPPGGGKGRACLFQNDGCLPLMGPHPWGMAVGPGVWWF